MGRRRIKVIIPKRLVGRKPMDDSQTVDDLAVRAKGMMDLDNAWETLKEEIRDAVDRYEQASAEAVKSMEARKVSKPIQAKFSPVLVDQGY